MNDKGRQDELLHGRLDDALTADEREDLDRLLAADADARRRARQLDELSEALGALTPIDPPPGLAQAVVRDTFGTPGGASTRGMTGGLVMRTKVMWGLAAAAAIVLAVLSYAGFPSAGDGTEGAIGAAKRYQAGQIGADDVKLGDQAAQDFLQSDLFDRILKDDAMRKALSDPAITRALADPALKLALTHPDFVAMARGVRVDHGMFDAALQSKLLDADFVNALKAPAISAAIADGSLGAALNDLALGRQLTDATLASALSDQALRLRLNDAAFLKALNNGALRVLLSDAAFLRALSHQGLVRLLTDAAFVHAIASADMQRAFADPGFAAALSSPRFGEAMRTRTRE